MTDTVVLQKTTDFFSAYPEAVFRKGDIIISAGEELQSIYYLQSGSVKMVGVSEEGEEIVLHVFRPPAYFPIMFSLSNTSNSYSFIAFEDVKARKAPISDVLSFIKSEPDVLLDLTTRFSSALTGLLVRIEGMVFQSAQLKIVSLFVYLSEKFGEDSDKGVCISLQLTHEDIAAWVGMRRETVSRQIEKLEKEGLLFFAERHYVIPKIDLLKEKLKNSPQM